MQKAIKYHNLGRSLTLQRPLFLMHLNAQQRPELDINVNTLPTKNLRKSQRREESLVDFDVGIDVSDTLDVVGIIDVVETIDAFVDRNGLIVESFRKNSGYDLYRFT